LLDQDPLS